MKKSLHILIVEDNPVDAELLLAVLRRAGFDPRWKRVETEPAFLAELATSPDIILSDYSMPEFSGLKAVELLQKSGLSIPFILISGMAGEDFAVEAIQRGATDYLLKDRIGRLGQVVERALREAQDQAELKQAAGKLNDAGRFAQSTIDALSAHLCVLDESGIILATNEAWRRFSKANPASVQHTRNGDNYLQACDSVTGSEAVHAAAFAAGIRAVIRERVEFAMEYPFQSPSEQRWFLGRVTRFPNDGPLRVVVTHEDITELKQVEAERKTALRELNDVRAALDEHAIVAITDPKGKITYVNDKFCAISKYSREELLGQDHRLINSGFHSKEFMQSLWQTIRAGCVWKAEMKNKAKDGTFYWVDTTIVPYLGDDGKPVQYVAIRADITERKRGEEQLQQTNVELENAWFAAEKANRAKSDFLSSMSHELRTPLNAILGFAQLMESASPPPTTSQNKSIAQILQAGWYLLKLINEILDLAAIESGKLSLTKEAVSLPELTRECQAMMEPQAQQRGVHMIFPAFDDPVFVSADRTRLKQILINLLSNAIKYNKQEGDVIVECTASVPERIRISVKDTGAGLTSEKLAHLFQPFNRLGQEATSIAGTGIGLVMSKRLVELMGGVIGVESTVGEGSLFWCELSLAEAPHPAVDSIEVEGLAPIELSIEGPRCNLLYIEDNPANMDLVEEIVGRFPDMGLITAANGTRGIELARSNHPQVILMDINLPGISGTKALRILREDPATAHIPVIALSANVMQRDIEEGLEAGFFRYLTKPLKIKEFMDTLGAALESVEEKTIQN